MQTSTVEARPVEVRDRPLGSAARRVNLVLGWTLLTLFMVSFGAFVLQGSVSASHYDLMKRLESDAARGATTTVEVVHFASRDADLVTRPMADHGYTTVDVQWRDGLIRRHTDYVLASSEAEARKATGQNETTGHVVIAPDTLKGVWSEVQPNLSIAQVETDGSSRGSTEIFGVEWFGPSWAILLGGLVAGLGTLTRLVVGPPPWRFTRWGWAWLVLLAWPVGLPAFLLFSGATGLFRPTDPARRLGGLAGLVLAVVLVGLGTAALT